MKKKTIIIIGVVVVMGAFVAAAIKNKPEVEETMGGYKNSPLVQVAYVEKEDIDTKVSSSGKLEAIDSKTLYLEATNKVVTLHKEVGDTVQAGELVITLDQEAQIEAKNEEVALKQQLAAAQKQLADLQGTGTQGEILSATSNIAGLKNQKAQTENSIKETTISLTTMERDLEEARKQLKMNEELLSEGLAAEQDVTNSQNTVTDIEQKIKAAQDSIKLAEGSLATFDLQIKSAQYNLDVLQKKVSDKTVEQQIAAKKTEITQLQNRLASNQNMITKASTQVVAPIKGVITYLPDEEGMTVAQGSPLLTVVDPSTLKVNCNISTYYAPDLRVGLEAIIKYSGSKTVEVPGKVTKVSPVAITSQTTAGESVSLPVEVQVTEPGAIIRPGFNVDVKIITDARKGVCTVPILAIEEEDDMSYVYVVSDEGILERREVTQGISMD